MTYTIDPIPLWTPNPATVGQTRMAQLIAAKGKANYAELWQWSVDEPEAFWSELWDFCGAVGEKGTKIVVDRSRMPGARWFPDAWAAGSRFTCSATTAKRSCSGARPRSSAA